MNTEIIAIYCICDDLIKILKLPQDSFQKMSDSEVSCLAIVAARFFHGNIELTRRFLKDHGYCHKMLSKSRLNRRIHALPKTFWKVLMQYFASSRGELLGQECIVDSFPVKACAKVRSSLLYTAKKFRGYNASKDEYFVGLKAHVVTNAKGVPINFLITPGSVHDMTAFKGFDFELLRGKIVYGDKAYNNYAFEEELIKSGTWLKPQRRKNSKRHWNFDTELHINYVRKRIETSFSQITSWLPRRIQATTPKGFELKVTLGIVAFALSFVSF